VYGLVEVLGGALMTSAGASFFEGDTFNFEGLVSPGSYEDDQDGLAAGVQIESWW
jgi:hypothetical protein